MPKELIIRPETLVLDESGKTVNVGFGWDIPGPDGATWIRPAFLEVHWGNQSFEVCTQIPREMIRSLHQEMLDYPGLDGKAVAVQVSRYDANRTIKVIRRARNMTYGADE